MHLNSLCLTTAVVASVFMLSACNKPATAPAVPATNPAAPAATGAVPAVPAAPVAAAPATTNPAVGGRGGRRMGGGRGGKNGMRAACADDIKKFCTGGGRVGKCLKSHASDLSQACAQAREQRKEARQAGR